MRARTRPAIAIPLCAAVACGGPTRGRDPDIVFQPEGAVVFGRVVVGESARVTGIVRNVGDGALHVDRVALAGAPSSPFALGEALGPFALEPGESRAFDVLYTPSAGQPGASDTIVIESDDPDEPSLAIPVTARQSGPHLRFDPPVLDFGLVEGHAGPSSSRLVSDGTEPVAIATVSVSAGLEFALTDGADAAGITLAPGESVDFAATHAFDPAAPGSGRVVVEAVEPGVPPAHLELRGPPVAIVGAEIVVAPLTGVVLDGSASRAPGNVVGRWSWTMTRFPAGSRTAEDFNAGLPQIVRDVVRCPAAQRALPRPCFFPDAPGIYEATLVVTDERPSCPLADPGDACGGDAACCSFDCASNVCAAGGGVCAPGGGCAIPSANAAIQTVRAIPEQAVFVSLSWDGPGDLDLHLVRDSSSSATAWTAIPDDAYWANPAPDWGVPDATNGVTCTSDVDCTLPPYTTCRRPTGAPSGECIDASDDPRLILDVTDAFGPEAIGIKLPPADVYHVGVHFFPDEQMAPRRATLRFFVLGEERFPPGFGAGSPLSTILSRNHLWYAARIVVPPILDDATIEAEPLAPALNPWPDADPGNYPAIP